MDESCDARLTNNVCFKEEPFSDLRHVAGTSKKSRKTGFARSRSGFNRSRSGFTSQKSGLISQDDESCEVGLTNNSASRD